MRRDPFSYAMLVAGVLLSISSPLVTGVAQAEEPTLEIDDLFELEEVRDPQISPDGSQIVYVRSGADVMADSRYSNLWLVASDGSRHRPLTTGEGSVSSPRWSPSGDRLVYLSDRDGSTQLWLRYLDTGQELRVTDDAREPTQPLWSPDGRSIAFAALLPAEPRRIGPWPKPPEGAEWAEPAKVIERLPYRFDQYGELPSGHWHWFVVPAEGGTPRQVTSGEFQHAGPGLRGGAWSAAWSRDGRALLVSANRAEDRELDPLDSEIWRFSIDGGEPRALTSMPGPAVEPAVSPDGELVAWVGYEDRYQGYQRSLLWVMSADGSGLRSLTDGLDRSVAAPRWSADGRELYFLFDSEGTTRIGSVTLEGEVREVVGGLAAGVSSYTSGSFSVAADGRFAATVGDPWSPGDVAVGRLRAGADAGVTKLTSVNDDLLGQRRLGEVVEIEYASSKDGRPIQGWYILPPGFDRDRRDRDHPLVLEIHGGPFAAYGPHFDFEKQILAAHGYVVLYVNPRGSTSYGEEFGNLIHHAYPGDDLHDLLSGVDAMLETGWVDPEQLYVTGGSGGGVLTSWVIGHSDRFRAAVTVYPVINWESWVLTADISAFGVRYWFPGLPWDHPENYDRRSLLSVVENVTTPTMVLTGEEDWRTPISESEQYFAALRHLGVESVFVRVPGEPHGIRRRPSHWGQKIASIVGWFEEHRPAPPEATATGSP